MFSCPLTPRSSSFTPLLKAGHIVQTLLESSQVDVNATYDTVAGHRCRDDCGGTALHKLLDSGGGWDAEERLACLKLLLDNKADPNLVSLRSSFFGRALPNRFG